MSLIKRPINPNVARPAVPGIPPSRKEPGVAPEGSSRSAPTAAGVGQPSREHIASLVQELSVRISRSTQGSARHLYRSQLLSLVDSESRAALTNSGLPHTPEVLKRITRDVMDELIGLGPLQGILDDPTVSEVMVNGPDSIWVERKGKLTETDVKFRNNEHAMQIIQRIIEPLGRKIDTNTPMVDARLPDGSRVNAIIPPCALLGPTITIRKFSSTPLTVDQLISFGSFTEEMAEFLRACVQGHLNIVVSGGTGSGKTSLLNVLSSFIPDAERIVTIEDAAELKLNQRHVVPLESRPKDSDGNAPILIRDLVINALRMRPERIIVGECRGPETLDMLQAMNTGHDGSLTTLHANTPRDALARMEVMTMMAGMDLPVRVIREQIASAVHLIVQQSRLRDGKRKVTHITEVQGMEGDKVVLQDVFLFKEEGIDADGSVIGEVRPTGTRPKFYERLLASGAKLPANVFGDPMGRF